MTPRLSCFTLLMQEMLCALALAFDSAGRSIAEPTEIGTMSKKTPDTIVPARASPWPPSWPPLSLILFIEIIPRMSPTKAVRPQLSGPRIPSTSDAIAMPLVLGAVAGVAIKGAGALAGLGRSAANSAKDPKVCQSAAPSDFTLIAHWPGPEPAIGLFAQPSPARIPVHPLR